MEENSENKMAIEPFLAPDAFDLPKIDFSKDVEPPCEALIASINH